METKKKTDKTRIKEKRLVQFQVIMRSQLIRGDFTMFIKTTMHDLKSKYVCGVEIRLLIR